MSSNDNAVNGSDSSESSSNEEEERLRRLFQLCDRDQDGFIDSTDLLVMCRQLNMEDSVDDIVHQLGADDHRRVSFAEFARCRRGLVAEIEREQQRSMQSSLQDSSPQQQPWQDGVASMSSSMSVDVTAASLFRLMEEHDPSALRQMLQYAQQSSGLTDEPNFAELANTLHLTALTSLKGENLELGTRLHRVNIEKEKIEKQLTRCQSEKHCLQRELSEKLQETTSRYEDRIIELHSVIAELRAKLDRHQINVIREVDEESCDSNQGNQSDCDVSINENNASQSASLADFGAELTADFTRVVQELENAIDDTKLVKDLEPSSTPFTNPSPTPNVPNRGSSERLADTIEQLNLDVMPEQRNIQETQDMVQKSQQMCLEVDAMQFSPPPLISPVFTLPSNHPQNATVGCLPIDHPSPTQGSHPTYDPSLTQGLSHSQTIELSLLQNECLELREHTSSLESDVKRLKTQNVSLREERDRMKRRTRELQTRVQSLEMIPVSPHHSRTSTPTKTPQTQNIERAMSGSSSEHGGANVQGGANVALPKIAELKRLKTSLTDRPLHGAEISSIGLPNTKIAEHLTQTLQEQCDIQEIVNASTQGGRPTAAPTGNMTHEGVVDNRIPEFEIEFERLTSKIDNLRSQNEVLALTLQESKAYSDRLTVLIGKYESNHVALQIAVDFSDRALQCAEVLTELLDTDRDMMVRNCKAAGIGSLGSTTTAGDSGMEGDEHDHLEQLNLALQTTQNKRRQAEHNAKLLIQNHSHATELPSSLPNPGYNIQAPSQQPAEISQGSYANPQSPSHANPQAPSHMNPQAPSRKHDGTWDCIRHTTSAASSTGSSVDMEFTRMDERRLRDVIDQLKCDRTTVSQTIVQLESIHVDSADDGSPGGSAGGGGVLNPNAQRLDLENAVLMQELMALKEEKAELRSHNYVLEKEKGGLELQLYGKQSQEQVYIVQIEHLKAEVQEQQNNTVQEENLYSSTPSITLAELRSNNSTEVSQDLANALKRERKLKGRVQELVSALEKLSHNSEVSHQQSAQFVNDLKHANSALVTAFEKAKRKYQTRMKKMENQISSLTTRYETQIHQLQLHISHVENRPPPNETSL